MNIILFDASEIRQHLLPLTYTRPISKLLVGLLTIDQKWQSFYKEASFSYYTADYLQSRYPISIASENLLINSSICPDEAIIKSISALKNNEVLKSSDTVIACRADAAMVHEIIAGGWNAIQLTEVSHEKEFLVIDRLWKIFSHTAEEILVDFPRITANRASQPVEDPHTIIYGKENVFIEEGVKIKAAVINAEGGPVYIGKNCQIHEGSTIQGPFGMGEGSILNMGAKIRPGTSVGPYCKLGGEVNNAVLIGYSNKGHEGFLGNSVLGEWCNLGADTNSSNLKNNYAPVHLWNYHEDDYVDTGLQFCGLIMGDHSKCSINTMFNTGTVVGVGANIFGAGFPPRHIPSFTWGAVDGSAEYRLNKVFEAAEKAMGRRNVTLTDKDRDILQHVFSATAHHRNIK